MSRSLAQTAPLDAESPCQNGRPPSGALFEAGCSHQPSFTCDEPAETLGTALMMSPQIEANKEEVLKVIGEIKDV